MPPVDDEPASFDPRTWGRPGGEKAQGASASEPSFDPATWRKPETPPSRTRRGPSGAVIAAAVTAVVLLGGGAWFAFQARPDAGAEEPAGADLATAERRTLVLASAGDLASALATLGVDAAQAQAAAAEAGKVLDGAAGELRVELSLRPTGSGFELLKLDGRLADGSGVSVTGTANGFAASEIAATTTRTLKIVRGEIDAESFYTSAVAAGVTDSLIPAFAQAFAFDFDFQREIAPGDVFEAAFERSLDGAGRPIGADRLVYASLQTAEKSRALYRFRPPGGEEGWYDGAGRSVVRSLMRTPVEGARVSSSFGYRTHPILGYQKLHRGIDFAAPTGTPVYASGDATVEFAGPRGAAGNFVSLLHDNGWRTTYMHLDSFAPGLKAGDRVRQTQAIGAVGTTGRSTGPHLHYEIHIDGEPVDPASIRTEGGQALSGEALAAFLKARDRIDAQRAEQNG